MLSKPKNKTNLLDRLTVAYTVITLTFIGSPVLAQSAPPVMRTLAPTQSDRPPANPNAQGITIVDPFENQPSQPLTTTTPYTTPPDPSVIPTSGTPTILEPTLSTAPILPAPSTSAAPLTLQATPLALPSTPTPSSNAVLWNTGISETTQPTRVTTPLIPTPTIPINSDPSSSGPGTATSPGRGILKIR